MGNIDFDKSPFLVIWETTQACDLACKHCRAEAQPDRHPDELTTAEAKKLLEDVRRFGPIIFVFSGGDCMKRPRHRGTHRARHGWGCAWPSRRRPRR
jgi:AdoMet-dependent heme synthase